MTDPYYQDDHVTLYHGDCREVLATLDVTASVLLTDPPYFKVKDDEWDNQWDKAHEFLSWLGGFLDTAKPLLAANGSVWVFASPAMTSSVERLVGERFRVLNSVRWVKEAGWHQKAELAAMRSFLTPWEGIVFAEQFGSDDAAADGSGWQRACSDLHKRVYAPLGGYLQGEWERAGWKAGKLGVTLGYDSALPTRWAEGSSLPTQDAYSRLRAMLGPGYFVREYEDLRREYEDLRREYEDLRREYEDLRREYEDLRRPFTITNRAHSTDVWNFPPVMPYPGKHPCEKPEAMLAHMIRTSSRPGDLVLDPFSGSGSTGIAAKALGRRAVLIEQDERWCEHGARRLAQDALNFEEPV